jgi:hypothetical protein
VHLEVVAPNSRPGANEERTVAEEPAAQERAVEEPAAAEEEAVFTTADEGAIPLLKTSRTYLGMQVARFWEWSALFTKQIFVKYIVTLSTLIFLVI